MFYSVQWYEPGTIQFLHLCLNSLSSFYQLLFLVLCSIRGPAIIIYFLHSPCLIRFQKMKVQRATCASITLNNVTMRVIYYLINTYSLNKTSFFAATYWGIYLFTAIFSIDSVLSIANLFNLINDNQIIIKGILTILLVLWCISLWLPLYLLDCRILVSLYTSSVCSLPPKLSRRRVVPVFNKTKVDMKS